MKAKSTYYCTQCGNEFARWMGQCTACGSWNTIVEEPAQKPTASKSVKGPGVKKLPKTLADLDTQEEIRFSTGIPELDRVLGGGAVRGSLVLVGGAPGIGKSTLLLQICEHIAATQSVLYVSGEESERQLKMRAERLGVRTGSLLILSETNMDDILDTIEASKPDVLIIDSIQTLYSPELQSSSGSVAQVKECTNSLMKISKTYGVTVFVIGHVNKEGAIAGPRVLEHMVDCVLYFESISSANHRVLRAAKNRFGSTNEIGVFEMLDSGLAGVPNPSELLLAGRPEKTPGTCVTCIIEGTRPILAEVQALLAPSSSNVPRRASNGIDYNRAMLLLAVIERRGGLRISNADCYINVIGGLDVDEPAADLAVVLSIASSAKDIPIPDDLAAIGEVGLTGEIRSVTQLEQRLTEITRMGFNKCIIPIQRRKLLTIPDGLTVYEVKTVREAFSLLLSGKI
ncbi:MAG: DNA repair protein RadA [Oscillospiraceae bacterium]|nr:DNA repair protein RadA [Oscillospiraceae bacterium]